MAISEFLRRFDALHVVEVQIRWLSVGVASA